MARILTAVQAQRMMQALAYINDIATNETTIELFNDKRQKIKVCFYGNRVAVTLFGAFPKDDKEERFGTQSQFAYEYGVLDN
jgi:hypothetical protein